MLLSARFLSGVASVNLYEVTHPLEMSAGDPVTVFLQLVDASLDRSGDFPGRRYVPAAGSTLQVVLVNVDGSKSITKNASQPYPTSDPSIWTFSIAASDAVRGTVTVQLVLTEGSVVRRGLLPAAIRVRPTST